VRASTVDTAGWDRRPLGEQERTVGRFKLSGSGLDRANDPQQPPQDPDFAGDAAGTTTPFTAHIRKANPRTPGDEARRVFRRGYPLVLADVEETKRGLVFVVFARTITTQFEFITRAWTANKDFPFPGAGVDALRAFEQVLCGGYFFAPPLDHAEQPWSWHLPAGQAVAASPEVGDAR
jgi:deferrochelatase/peroxidase EfeB